MSEKDKFEKKCAETEVGLNKRHFNEIATNVLT